MTSVNPWQRAHAVIIAELLGSLETEKIWRIVKTLENKQLNNSTETAAVRLGLEDLVK